MKRFFFTSVILSLLTSILLSFNAHAQNEFVDLGLSVTWATCNVGANSPEENGEYYTFDNALTLENNGNRLPTKEEFQELLDNCKWKWTKKKRVWGYKATSKKNGNSIFLPAAGYRDSTNVHDVGSYGYLWSSSVYGSDYAHCLNYYIDGVYTDSDYRTYRRPIRLVQDVKK